MIETFVFSSEHVFLNEDQTKIRQLLDYLKSRKQHLILNHNHIFPRSALFFHVSIQVQRL